MLTGNRPWRSPKIGCGAGAVQRKGQDDGNRMRASARRVEGRRRGEGEGKEKGSSKIMTIELFEKENEKERYVVKESLRGRVAGVGVGWN